MTNPLVLINGVDGQSVNAFDRGLAYGDGVFETIKIVDHTPIFLQQHLQRLELGCSRLRIPLTNDFVVAIEQDLALLCAKSDADMAVAKVIVTRGAGGRGYRFDSKMEPQRVVSLSRLPEYPEIFQKEGIRLTLCDTRLADNPQLAQIKHLNRLEQVLARSEWEDQYQEGVLRTYDEQVVEGTMSNLFLVSSDKLLTPSLERCGVQGILRDWVLEQASKRGIATEIRDIHLPELLAADGLFMTNSVIGIWPVREFNNRDYQPHVICKELQQLLLNEEADQSAKTGKYN